MKKRKKKASKMSSKRGKQAAALAAKDQGSQSDTLDTLDILTLPGFDIPSPSNQVFIGHTKHDFVVHFLYADPIERTLATQQPMSSRTVAKVAMSPGSFQQFVNAVNTNWQRYLNSLGTNPDEAKQFLEWKEKQKQEQGSKEE